MTNSWGGHVVRPIWGCDGILATHKGRRLGDYRGRDCEGGLTVCAALGRLPEAFGGDADKTTAYTKIKEHVETDSELHTDERSAYDDYSDSIRSYANSVGFMRAVLQRDVYGTRCHLSVDRLARYANEAKFQLGESNVKIHTLSLMASFFAHALKQQITYERRTA